MRGGQVQLIFEGKIDEVRVYNRDLSVAEIVENFQEKPDLPSNILARIPGSAFRHSGQCYFLCGYARSRLFLV